MRYFEMPYIFIANIFWKIFSFIPQKVRNVIAAIFCAALMFIYTNAYCPSKAKIFYLDSSIISVLVYGLLALIIVLCMNKKAEPVPFNIWLFVPGAVFVLWMLLAYSMHSIGVGFFSLIIALIVIIPAGAVALNDISSRETFVTVISLGMVIASGVTLVLSLIYEREFFSEDGLLLRYSGITRNSNLFAMLMLAAIIGLLYLIAKKFLPRVILWILFVSFFAFLILTQSRSALICVFGCLLFFFVWCIEAKRNGRTLNDGNQYGTKKFMKILLIVLIVIIFLMILAVIIMRPIIISMLTGSEMEWASEDSQIYDIVNRISSMRLGLWIVVYEELNIYGHDVENFGDLLPERYQYDGAHNTALEFGYRCGIPCGAAFLLFELLACVYALVQVKTAKTDRPDQTFIIMAIISFFVESMLEIQVLPSNRNITMLFFIVSMLILTEPREKVEIDIND